MAGGAVSTIVIRMLTQHPRPGPTRGRHRGWHRAERRKRILSAVGHAL
jgi:hypothetical protein